MHTVNEIENFCFYRIQEMGIFFNQSIFNVLLQPCWNCWGNLKSASEWKWPVRIRYFVATSKFKYLQNLLYRGNIIVLCLWHLEWNQYQTMIVACHLFPVLIWYHYVYHLLYCSKDRHYYSSCCHCCYFRGHCFCCC